MNFPSRHTTVPDSAIVAADATFLNIGTCTSPRLAPGTVALTVAHTLPTAGAVLGVSGAAPLQATRTISCPRNDGGVGDGPGGPGTQYPRGFGTPIDEQA